MLGLKGGSCLPMGTCAHARSHQLAYGLVQGEVRTEGAGRPQAASTSGGSVWGAAGWGLDFDGAKVGVIADRPGGGSCTDWQSVASAGKVLLICRLRPFRGLRA